MDEQTIKKAIDKINKRLDVLEKRQVALLDILIESAKEGRKIYEH